MAELFGDEGGAEDDSGVLLCSSDMVVNKLLSVTEAGDLLSSRRSFIEMQKELFFGKHVSVFSSQNVVLKDPVVLN